MRLIFTLFFLSIFTIPLFCQNKEYTTHNEYSTDSTGKSILQTGLKYQRISNNSSWGFKDTIGNIIIPLGKYRFLNPIDEQGMILAKKGGKKGFIDINENVLIPFIYDDIGVFSKCVDLAPAVKNKKQGFINRKGEIIIPFEYDYTSYVRYFYEPGIAVLLKNGKYGVIDAENKIIIPFIYTKIDFEKGNEFIIAWQQEKWACFSTTGKQLNYDIWGTPFGFQEKDGKHLPILAITQETKNYAYLDKNHNFIIPFGVYDYADVFGLERKARVANKGKYGIIDELGELVLPLEYDFVEPIYSNDASVFFATKQNTVTIFDEKLNVIPTTGIVSYLNDGYGSIFVTNQENKKGLVNDNGIQTIPFLYDTLYQEWSYPQVKGYIAKKDGFYGFISRDNKIIQPFKYNYIYVLNGYAVYVDQNNKVGIFDENGKIMIPFEYDAIYKTYYSLYIRSDYKTSFPNIENIYIVEKDGKIGTIDDKNNVIIPIIYDGLSDKVEYGPEVHFVKNKGKYGIISPKGEIIMPIEYEYVGRLYGGLIEVKKDGKYGVVSLKNKEILPCIYDNFILDILFIEDGGKWQDGVRIVVSKQNIWEYYDLDGKLLQSNVPLKEINDKYDYILNRRESSSESYDLDRDIKQKGGLKMKIRE